MARIANLDSKQVLTHIRRYSKLLRSALQDGEDYAALHEEIIRLLKVICSTKSEYKDVVCYPKQFLLVYTAPDEKGNQVEVDRISKYPGDSLIKTRSELGERILSILAELEAEYKLGIKLKASCEKSLRSEMQQLRKEVSALRNEFGRINHL
jgi:hypothetical protein